MIPDEEDFDWGDEAYVTPLNTKPLTQAEIAFWFTEIDEDGNEVPPSKWQVN